MLASDHSPSTPAMKLLDSGNFLAAWGGIAGGSRILTGAMTDLRVSLRVSPLARRASWGGNTGAHVSRELYTVNQLQVPFLTQSGISYWFSEMQFVFCQIQMQDLRKLSPRASCLSGIQTLLLTPQTSERPAAGIVGAVPSWWRCRR